MTLIGEAQDRIAERFADAGVQGWLHAVELAATEGPELALSADDPVVMSSVFKLPVLVAFCRAVDAGDVDPRTALTVTPNKRTVGPTGLSILLDPVTMSLRDLVSSMITVSDNAAADAVLELLGFPRVAATLAALGLSHTRVDRSAASMFDELREELGVADLPATFALLADHDRPVSPRAYDPVLSSSTTARDMTALLGALWRDTAASPQQCAFARRLLGQRIMRTRLAAGFPFDDVRTSGKTGTLGALRHEVGVVEYPDEPPVAIAVFTHAARVDQNLPSAEAVIGEAAHLAVTALRLSRER
jgi:beta-lactamase class A